MKITSAQYHKRVDTEEIISIRCIIDEKEMFVPLDPNNRHYAEILRQVKEEGLTIKDAD